MARPCGCAGECGCTIVGVDGVRVSGGGTLRDPYLVGLGNPLGGNGCEAVLDCVGGALGPGLAYDDATNTILARISTDGGNTITFGTDSGLYSAGGTGGGDSGGATVDGLVASTQTIVGGSYGAGFSFIPEGDLRPYQVAMDMELPLIHVPVRRSTEGYLFAQHHRNLGAYNFRFNGAMTENMDMAMAQNMVYVPGGDPQDPWWQPNFPPKQGYFGFGAPQGHKMPLLSQIFELTQRRAVLYLEVKDVGASANDTVNPIETYRALRAAIRRWGVTKNVIVGSEIPLAANSIVVNQIHQGMAELRADGVATALQYSSTTQMDNFPAATIAAQGFTWAFCSFLIADGTPARVKAYKDAGLNTMLFTCQRQWHFRLIRDTVLFGPGGLKGGLFSDPVYAAGDINGYRYFEQGGTYAWSTPNYGQHAYVSHDIGERNRDRYRGYVPTGAAGHLKLDGDVLWPNEDPDFRESGYFILQGEQCPAGLPNYDAGTNTSNNYEIHVGFLWEDIVVDTGRWMSVFFGVPQDREMYEWNKENQYTKGYQLQLQLNGTFVLTRWDGIPYPGSGQPALTVLGTWPSGWGNPVPADTELRLKIEVRPQGIAVARADNSSRREFYNADATVYRGPYWYLGRHFFNVADSTGVRFIWPLCRPLP